MVISDPYEPGSVFKLITAAAALDSGSISMDSTYYCIGYKEVAGNKIHCWKRDNGGHGMQDLTQAMKHSCNPAFIEIGQQTGVENFTTYFDRFGLGDLTGIDLPGEADNSSMHYNAKTMGISELSSSAFGQTFKVSSLQLVTALSAALNGGNLMQPYVVKQIIDSDRNIVETTEPTVKRQVISEQTSQKVCYLGEQVVAGGSDASVEMQQSRATASAVRPAPPRSWITSTKTEYSTATFFPSWALHRQTTRRLLCWSRWMSR